MVREAKFHKQRLLALHASTEQALEQYLKRRLRIAGQDAHLFVSRRGGGLSHTVVAETFHEVLQAAGIPSTPEGTRPRLMDLRHSFAVKTLLDCPGERDHVGRNMLALTTYLGHAKVDSTYWYLESVPQLMTDIAGRCEAFLDGGSGS